MKYLNLLKTYSLWGNTFYDYFMAIVIFVVAMVILKLFQVVVISRLRQLAQKTKTDFDDVLIDIFTRIKPPFYLLVSIYVAVFSLDLSFWADKIIQALFLVVVIYEVINGLQKIVDYFLVKYLEKIDQDKTSKAGSQSMARAASLVVKIVLWVFGVILIMSNLGINVTSLVAGLGIGGIAVALAVQNILGDMFSSFSIYLDQPFKVGDFIMVGQDMGVVEKIGIKTTRIRTLQGEELVVSNNELTKARIQNFKKMQKRRVVFSIGVIYGTSAEKLEQIPAIIKDIIDKADKADFDRCHFKMYGDFNLIYETVFFVNSSDYNQYMDINQEINLGIYKAFEEVGIVFAYPTQTIELKK